eukprot:Pgem_evm1s1427
MFGLFFFLLSIVNCSLNFVQGYQTYQIEGTSWLWSYANVFYPENNDNDLSFILIISGFQSHEEDVRDWGPFYAEQGYVAVTIEMSSVWLTPQFRAQAFIQARKEMARQSELQVDSPLYQRLSNRWAYSGWSMGGGGALIAAKKDVGTSAVAAFSPWLASVNAVKGLNVPFYASCGLLDLVAHCAIHGDRVEEKNAAPSNVVDYMSDHFWLYKPQHQSGAIGREALKWMDIYLKPQNQ